MSRTEDEVRETVELLKLMVKTRKVLRLYENENEISTRLEDSLASSTQQHLERWGACELSVLESEIRLDEEVVFRPSEGTDNLAFLLFRDGIRQLTFLPGVDRSELHHFLEALNHVASAGNAEDDLVTIFWDHDFQHIRYAAVEELPQEGGGMRLEEELASGRKSSGSGGAAEGGVDLEDLRRPVKHLPIESCNLTDDETEELHRQMAGLETEEWADVVIDLAIDLLLLSEEPDAREDLMTETTDVLGQMLAVEGPDEVARALDRLDDLLAGRPDMVDELLVLRRRLIATLETGERVAAILEGAEQHRMQPERLRSVLARLGPAALVPMVASMAAMRDEEQLRAVAEVVAGSGEAGARAVAESIDHTPAIEGRMVRVALRIARAMTTEVGLPILERLLRRPEVEIRLQAARALGPYREGAVGARWVELLSAAEEQLRMLAVTAMVRGGDTEAVRFLIEQASTEGFNERSPEEKQHMLSAIGKLGRDTAVGWLEQVLESSGGGLFTARATKDLLRAAAYGLRAVGTSRSREALKRLAASAPRPVRAACREALEEHGS